MFRGELGVVVLQLPKTDWVFLVAGFLHLLAVKKTFALVGKGSLSTISISKLFPR